MAVFSLERIRSLAQEAQIESGLIADFIRPTEGLKHELYKPQPTEKKWTFGRGHTVEEEETLTTDSYSDEAIERKFREDVDKHIEKAKTLFTDYDTYPLQVKKVLTDGTFRGDFVSTHDTVKHINAGKWDKVSKEYKNRGDYRRSKASEGTDDPFTGVYKRIDRNAKVLEEYGNSIKEEDPKESFDLNRLNPFSMPSAEAAEPPTFNMDRLKALKPATDKPQFSLNRLKGIEEPKATPDPEKPTETSPMAKMKDFVGNSLNFLKTKGLSLMRGTSPLLALEGATKALGTLDLGQKIAGQFEDYLREVYRSRKEQFPDKTESQYVEEAQRGIRNEAAAFLGLTTGATAGMFKGGELEETLKKDYPLEFKIAKTGGDIISTLTLVKFFSPVISSMKVAPNVAKAIPTLQEMFPSTARILGGMAHTGLVGVGVGGTKEAIRQFQSAETIDQINWYSIFKEGGWSGLQFAPWGIVPGTKIGLQGGLIGTIKRAGAAAGLVGGGSLAVDMVRRGRITQEDLVSAGVNATVAAILQGYNAEQISRQWQTKDLTDLEFNKDVARVMANGKTRQEAEEIVKLVRWDWRLGPKNKSAYYEQVKKTVDPLAKEIKKIDNTIRKAETDFGQQLQRQMQAKEEIPLHPAEAGREGFNKIYPWQPKVEEREVEELKEEAPKVSPKTKILTGLLKEEISEGEAGKRLKIEGTADEGDKWIGLGSSFPDYFQNKGYTQKETLKIIDKVNKGEELTPKQQRIFDDLQNGIVKAITESEEYYGREIERIGKEQGHSEEDIARATDAYKKESEGTENIGDITEVVVREKVFPTGEDPHAFIDDIKAKGGIAYLDETTEEGQLVKYSLPAKAEPKEEIKGFQIKKIEKYKDADIWEVQVTPKDISELPPKINQGDTSDISDAIGATEFNYIGYYDNEGNFSLGPKENYYQPDWLKELIPIGTVVEYHTPKGKVAIQSFGDKETIGIKRIEVDKKGTGFGTYIMNQLKTQADKTGKKLLITDTAGSEKFYDKFDFLTPLENKTMYQYIPAKPAPKEKIPTGKPGAKEKLAKKIEQGLLRKSIGSPLTDKEIEGEEPTPEPLIEEAKKYKSAEEFVEKEAVNFKSDITGKPNKFKETTAGREDIGLKAIEKNRKIVQQKLIDNVNAEKSGDKIKAESIMKDAIILAQRSNKVLETFEKEYGSYRQPYDIDAMKRKIVGGMREAQIEYSKDLSVLEQSEDTITVYRGIDSKTTRTGIDKNIVPGDFVSLDKGYANEFGDIVLELSVPKSSLRNVSGTKELIFNPTKSQLTDIWNKANAPKEGGVETKPEVEKVVGEIEKKPLDYTPNTGLIDKKMAYFAYQGTSFSPEKRGEQEIVGFGEELKSIYDALKPLAKSPEAQKILVDEMRLLEKTLSLKKNDLLRRHSGLYSSMIAGPSNFPVEQMRRKNNAYQATENEYYEFIKRAKNAIAKKLNAIYVQQQGGEIEVIKKKIANKEKLQEVMKQANAIIRKNISDEEKIKELTPIVGGEKNAIGLLKPDFTNRKGFATYQLQSNLADIKRLKERISTLESRDVRTSDEIKFEGGTIYKNSNIDRIQIFYDSKPSDEIIAKLKSKGFHWSPSNEAWQRQWTRAAEYATEDITGVKISITKPKGGGAAGASVAAAPAVAERPKGYGIIEPSEKSAPEPQAKSDYAKIGESIPSREGTNIIKEALKIVSPATVTEVTREAGHIVRKNLAELARKDVIAIEALKKAHAAFTWMNKEDSHKFIDDVEEGRPQPKANLQPFADLMRTLLDQRRMGVQNLGKGQLEAFYENYFPHIWKDPKQAQDIISKILGIRKLEGSKSFLKKRVIVSVKDGLDRGLELVSDNPVDLVLLKLHEIDRYIMAQHIIRELKAKNLVKFVYSRSKAPDGYARINDSAFTVYMPPELTKKEAYDSILVDQLSNIAESLGIDSKRFVSIGGKRWGYAQLETGVVRTKYAGPESVLAHEIGHIIGKNYDVYNLIGRRKEGEYKTHEKGKKAGQEYFKPSKEAVEYRRDIDAEWRALADARFKGLKVSPGYQSYVRKSREKEAVLIEALIHAPDEFRSVAPELYKYFTKFLNSRSELRPLLDVRPSLVLGESEAKIKIPGFTTLGHFYAPEDVSRLINNHLSPGLRNHQNKLVSGAYNILRGVGNVLNQVNLSLSLFHAINVSTDMAASTVGLGIKKMITKGQFARGLKDIAVAPISPIIGIWEGTRLKKAYRTQMSQIKDPRLKVMVEAIVIGGGRDRMDIFYYNQQIKALQKTFTDIIKERDIAQLINVAKLPFQMFGATVEVLAKPIMEWYVPTGKLGLFSKLAQFEMKRAEMGQITDEQLIERLVQVWDSVDNRMGQLIYDNLFWNKAMKDSLMLAIRSVGWNLGSWREYAGAGVDLLTVKARLRRGDQVISQKMAYVMGAAIVYAILGAIITYLLTGERPRELKDYFFPRTGAKNPDGSDERLSLPTYAKDIYAYSQRPLETVRAKAHPLIGLLNEEIRNKDFLNTLIADPNDYWYDRIVSRAEHIAKYARPFSFKNYEKMQKAEASPFRSMFVSITGITSAPSYVVRSPAQKLMYRYIIERIPPKVRTKEDREKSEYRKSLINRKRKGEEIDAREAIEYLGKESWRKLLREMELPPFAASFQRLPLEEALNVYSIASKEEKEQTRNLLIGKYKRARKRTPEMIDLYLELLEE